jgi:hypothetical protein
MSRAKDPILALAEIVNYKSVPQDVYLSLDMEYVQFNTSVRPADYLDVNFGTILVEQCGSGISLREYYRRILWTEVLTSQRPSER